MKIKFLLTATCIALSVPGAVLAQGAPLYGAQISLEDARKATVAAEGEARTQGIPVAITIVDSGAQMVLQQRMDGTQYASTEIAHAKAVTAVRYKRPTKAFEDAVSGGGAGLRVLKLDGVMPFQGGLPIVAHGKIIGAIGVSGGTPAQDGLIASAAAAAVAAASK